MPPKKKFSKEQIIDAAFEIAKSEGIDRITIRKVAKELKSSVAPVYVNFDDVNDLKQAVVAKVVQLSHEMIAEINSGSPFADIGTASIRFAKTYPVLFRDFVMKQNEYMNEYDQQIGGDLVGYMQEDPELEGFSEEELALILFKMRTFQVGLCVMIANGLLDEEYDEETLIAMSDRFAEDIITVMRLNKNDS